MEPVDVARLRENLTLGKKSLYDWAIMMEKWMKAKKCEKGSLSMAQTPPQEPPSSSSEMPPADTVCL